MSYIYRLLIVAAMGIIFYQGNVSFAMLFDITGVVSLLVITLLSLSASFGMKTTIKLLLMPFVNLSGIKQAGALNQVSVALYFSSAMVFLAGVLIMLNSNQNYQQFPSMLATSALPIFYAMIFSEVLYRPAFRSIQKSDLTGSQ